MDNYQAPIRDIMFALTELANINQFSKKTRNQDISCENIKMILEEAGKFASEKIAVINQKGDQEGVKLENGIVRMPEFFIKAYKEFVNKGWFSVIGDKKFGGQDMPMSVLVAINEIWEAANMSFAVNNMLTQGAIELISEHGSQDQKSFNLPNLISGKWSGTMNLTEPHAGSDLSTLKTKAEKTNKNKYLIKGTKIYITHGDQDMSDNIIHMVLAKLPNSPPGVKGISLFLVPKYYYNDDGKRVKNDIKVLSIEHKLGHNASPTCVLSFGESVGALGELIGEPNQGLKAMFTMMNNARLNVGVQGLAIAERAYQKALNFAKERKQGKSISTNKTSVEIINHPDVKRMLMEMKSQVEAMRGLAIMTGEMIDYQKKFPSTTEGKDKSLLANLLTPIVKSWCTDQSVYLTSLGLQVHGGMGFIEDTGAAQYFRDSRILPIYEGTNGIQALDLLGRKIFLDNGRTFDKVIFEIEDTISKCILSKNIDINSIGNNLTLAKDNLKVSCNWLKEVYENHPQKAAAGATPFLNMFGWILGGWVMANSSLKSQEVLKKKSDDVFFINKIKTALFFSDTYLPLASAQKSTILNSHKTINIIN